MTCVEGKCFHYHNCTALLLSSSQTGCHTVVQIKLKLSQKTTAAYVSFLQSLSAFCQTKSKKIELVIFALCNETLFMHFFFPVWTTAIPCFHLLLNKPLLSCS